MRFNEAGLALIKQFEGCQLHAYPDPATGAEPWTVGWGSIGPDIGPTTVWTQEYADFRLQQELDEKVSHLKPLITIELTDNEFSAIVSLAYNIGVGNFKISNLRKILNAGGVQKAADEFVKWNHANGKVMAGLTRRRLAERRLFLT